MLRKLTRRQVELLKMLSTTEWRKAPLLTKAATILSLEKRGLIRMRVPDRVLAANWMMWYVTYSEYKLRLTEAGIKEKKGLKI